MAATTKFELHDLTPIAYSVAPYVLAVVIGFLVALVYVFGR
jgi:hypothetical protein